MTVYVIFDRTSDNPYLMIGGYHLIFPNFLDAQAWQAGDSAFVIKEMKLEEIK